jgi:hypothetical protein
MSTPQEEKKEKKDTYYTLVNRDGGEEGRYKGNGGPAAAASKAASRRFGSNNNIRVTVRELGTDKTFSYHATRVKLDKPFISTLDNGETIERKFRTHVKAIGN